MLSATNTTLSKSIIHAVFHENKSDLIQISNAQQENSAVKEHSAKSSMLKMLNNKVDPRYNERDGALQIYS